MNDISMLSAAVAILGAVLGVGVFLVSPSFIKSNPDRLKIGNYASIGFVLAFIALSVTSYFAPPLVQSVKNDVIVPLSNVPVPIRVPAPQERTQPIDETYSSNSDLWNKTARDYIRRFPATPGYRIKEIKFELEKFVHAEDIRTGVNRDGTEAYLLFRLTAGSQSDRHIGQIRGRAILIEVPIGSP